MKTKKFLVYYYNGLVETNILIFATSEGEAKKIVEEDESFVKNQCYGEWYITKVECNER